MCKSRQHKKAKRLSFRSRVVKLSPTTQPGGSRGSRIFAAAVKQKSRILSRYRARATTCRCAHTRMYRARSIAPDLRKSSKINLTRCTRVDLLMQDIQSACHVDLWHAVELEAFRQHHFSRLLTRRTRTLHTTAVTGPRFCRYNLGHLMHISF